MEEANPVKADGPLTFHFQGPVDTLTTKRSSQQKALNQGMWTAIRDWVRESPPLIRLVVMQGSPGVFTASRASGPLYPQTIRGLSIRSQKDIQIYYTPF